MEYQPLQTSDYRIRKLIGVLGLLLPLILPLSAGQVLASMSHYYYEAFSSLIFIVVLSAFGLFLLSYKGYTIDKTTEKISDDFLTNIGGLAALVVVGVPTNCSASASDAIQKLCSSDCMPLLGHTDDVLNAIHLISAGVFILCMGWMSRYKFTRGSDYGNHKLYRCCGNFVFISVALILMFIGIEHFVTEDFFLKTYYVFIFETTAVISFGVSWLVKGKGVSEMKALRNRLMD